MLFVVILHIFGKVKGAALVSAAGSATPDMAANDLWTSWRKKVKIEAKIENCSRYNQVCSFYLR